ncbi:mCG148251 [Mus musculus]|nr:mCG148251 [Mus musculus]
MAHHQKERDLQGKRGSCNLSTPHFINLESSTREKKHASLLVF